MIWIKLIQYIQKKPSLCGKSERFLLCQRGWLTSMCRRNSFNSLQSSPRKAVALARKFLEQAARCQTAWQGKDIDIVYFVDAKSSRHFVEYVHVLFPEILHNLYNPCAWFGKGFCRCFELGCHMLSLQKHSAWVLKRRHQGIAWISVFDIL